MLSVSPVLLVDSSADGLEMYSTALALEGIATSVATSGSAAITRLDEEHPRVMVTGLRLAGTEATDLIAHARRSTPPMFIVGLSSTDSDASRAAYAAGCDLVLPIPCLPETLVGELRRALA